MKSERFSADFNILPIFDGKVQKKKSLKCLIFSDFLNLLIFTCGPTWA